MTMTDELRANIVLMRKRIADGSLAGDDRVPVSFAVKIADEVDRLEALINNPHTTDFLEAVRLEAAHQRERWGTEHDAGKTDADWFWLIGHLAGKALHAAMLVDHGDISARLRSTMIEKSLHHIITTAAALLNWHAARTGADTRMRPGIETPSDG